MSRSGRADLNPRTPCAAHGKPFAPQSLYQLFTNPFYAGILVDPWTGEEYLGKHPPLVSREEFARVERAVAVKNRSIAHLKERDEFPLRGFARCDACRHGLTAAFSRGRSSLYPYYLCCYRPCTRRGKSLRAADVHSEFTSFLDGIAPRPQLIQEIGDTLIKMAERDERDLTQQREHRRKRIRQLEAEVIEVIRMRAQNLITNEEFLVQKKRLADQRAALESQGQPRTDIASVRADLEKIVQPLSTLRKTWESLKAPLRTRFDHLILPGGFVIGRIRTVDLGPLFSFFRASMTGVSSVVPLRCVPSNRIISEIHEFYEVICSTTCIDD